MLLQYIKSASLMHYVQ